MADARQRHVDAIRAAERELLTAGPIHRRDLQKHINRMKKELKIYDFHMRQKESDHPCPTMTALCPR